jgi:deoxycytidine triphosphate deaminase
MAEQEGMIEPFAPDQVRMDGERRLISYGTSSYGYDVRCSREFKVFTNIHSATVDPKHFDENSFVHVEGDVCVIPPNSFALACTVDYLPGEIDLCALRHHRECDATGARMGGPCDTGVLKYDHLAGENLCQ